VLWSFRRCPYAIRDPAGSLSAAAGVELREVSLQGPKPPSFWRCLAEGHGAGAGRPTSSGRPSGWIEEEPGEVIALGAGQSVPGICCERGEPRLATPERERTGGVSESCIVGTTWPGGRSRLQN